MPVVKVEKTEERLGGAASDERDVVERVGRREYDAGAVSGRTIEALRADGTLAPEGLRIIWSSPGYSHCCFTAHSDMDPALVEKLPRPLSPLTRGTPPAKRFWRARGAMPSCRGLPPAGRPSKKRRNKRGLFNGIGVAQSA